MSHAQLLRRSLIVAGLALTLARCRDSFEPGLTARLAVAPILPSRAELAEFGLTIDAVRFVVVRPGSETLADTTVVVPPGATELALDLRVPLLRNPDTVEVSIVALSGTMPLFSGTQLVPVPTPLPPPEVAVDTYLGPVVDSLIVVPNAPFILLNDSLRFQVLGFNAGAPVSQFYVAWSTSDTALARIDARGMLRAPATRSSVRVRARTPSGVTDSVLATFTPVATQLVTIAGGGQSDTVGDALAIPLEVEARAADGLGVGGVTVRFRAVAGGGSVADSLVVTDAAGRARTAATLGSLLGAQSFEASVTGLSGSPLTFSATALAGPPASLAAVLGDAQLAIVGSAVPVAPAVVVRDAGGNPVQGVSVVFSITGGGGSVSGGSQVTDANGIATVGGWTLGTGAGSNTLRATAGPLTRTFTATGIAGPAAQLVATAGDLQSALVGMAVAIDPAVRVEDQYGNPIAGATVAFAVSAGGGSVSGATQLTNAGGIATVGSWGLGTAAGVNTLTASLSGGGVTPVAFSATGLAGTATTILKLAGDLQTGVVNTLLGTAPRVKLVDQFGNPVAGTGVTFAVSAGGGSLAGATQTTDTAGHATVGGWTLGTAVGTNELTASAGSLSSTFSASALPGVASQIAGVAGNNQTALVNTIVAVAPVVIVRDQFNNPVPGVAVTFTPSAGGAVTAGAASTDSAGVAAVGSWELDSIAGANTLTATAGSLTTQFSANGLAGAITQLVKTAGDGLSAVVGTAVATPPTVRALDQYGNPVGGASVLFSVTAGNGLISGATPTTNANGFAAAGAWTLDTLVGANRVTATAGGGGGGGGGGQSAVFDATGRVGAPSRLLELAGDSQTVVVNTAVPVTPAVRLTDRYGNPVAGAAVFFDIRVDGGSVADSLPLTDATGLATPGSWVLTDFVSTNLLDASVAGLPAVRFTAFTLPDAPAQLLRASTDTQTALAGQAVEAPPVIEVRDQFFNSVPGVTVDFRLTGALLDGSVTPTSTTTDAFGVARVTNWTLSSTVGLNTLEATSAAVTADTIVFSATGITTTATNMVLAAGDGQTGVVAQALTTPYSVRVLDGSGAPVQGVQVRWTAGQGGAMSPVTSVTNLSGIASSTRILGQIAGPQSATASVGQLTGSPVTFNATALADTAFQIIAVAGDGQSAPAGTQVVTAPAVQVTDAFGNAIAGLTVTFTPAAGSVTGGTPVTDATGVAGVGSWRLGTLAGADSLAATAGSLAPVVFSATVTAAGASDIVLLDGDGQVGSVGQVLAAPYRVTVFDQFGNPVPGVAVDWAIGARSGGSILPASVLTNSAGVAAATHTLGTVTGSYAAFATIAGLPDTVTFTSTAVAGAAATLVKVAGDSQSAVVNTLVSASPSVQVTDQFGAPVANHTVTWAVVSGGGSLTGNGAVTTDSTGIAGAPPWTLGTAAGTNVLSATAPGLDGSPITFTATGLADVPLQVVIKEGNNQSATVNSAVPIKPAVIVRDQFNNPVPLVQVTFTVLSGGGSATGTTPLTNLQGVATVGSWTLGTVAGTNSLRASVAGLQPQTFTATGTAGAAARVGFVAQPVRALAGDTLEGVHLAVQDQFGNIVFGAQIDVTVGLGAAGNPAAKLVGTTVVPTVNGIASFGDLAIDSAGTGYTLVGGAIAAPLSGDETVPFDVGGVISAVQADRLGPVDAAFDKASGFVYIPGETGNTLAVFDPNDGTLANVAQIPSTPFAVAVNSRTQRIYVTTLEGLAVFDGRSNALITVVQVGQNPRGVAVDEEADRVFVTVLGDSLKGELPYVVPIDGKDLVPGGPILFPQGSAGAAGLAFNPIDRLLYVAVPNGGVVVIDPDQRAPVAFISILGKEGAAGTYGVAVDVRANLVYATNRIEGTLSLIDPGKLEEMLRLPVGRLPEAVSVDADRGAVYVGNYGDGTVSFIDAGKLAVIATLVVGPTPKAIAVDAASSRFYVPTRSDDRVRVVQP